MLTIMATCLLGLVVLTPCSPESADVARTYSDYALAVPPEHLALIRELYWIANPNRRGESWYQTGRVGLPRKAGLHVLAHEVGHLATMRGGLIERYWARFWPGGVQLGNVPSRYGQINVYEDAAEAYARIIEGDPGGIPERAAWLRAALPELARR